MIKTMVIGDAGLYEKIASLLSPVEGTVAATTDMNSWSDADVIISFSEKEKALENLEMAAGSNKPIVMGTMGFTDDEMDRVKLLADRTRCVLVPVLAGFQDFSARGALRAAKWIVKQRNGLYDMQDIT